MCPSAARPNLPRIALAALLGRFRYCVCVVQTIVDNGEFGYLFIDRKHRCTLIDYPFTPPSPAAFMAPE